MNKKGRILMVDNDRERAFGFQGFFKALGHYTSVALHDDEAVKLIDSTPFDIVLLDIRPSIIHGLNLLQHIKATKPKTKVIAVTRFDHEAKEKAEKIGIDDYFAEPVEVDDLLKSVERLLETS